MGTLFDISNRTFDRLKWLVQIVLPALGTFYYVLASIWGWPAAEAVVASIVALCTLLGTVLQISTKRYDPDDDTVGDILIANGDLERSAILAFEHPPENLTPGTTVRLKVLDGSNYSEEG
jgi:hypothetical protein